MAYPLTAPSSPLDVTDGSARRVCQSPPVSLVARFSLAVLVGFLAGLAILYVALRPLARRVRQRVRRVVPDAIWTPWSAQEAAALLRRHG